MKIADLPIPPIVKEKLEEEGIKNLYPPQTEAVKKGLFESNNLVVAIPTASGKTLIALLSCIKAAFEKGTKTLYLSPLRALAYEKFVEFKKYMDLIGRKTILLTGDYDSEDTSAKYADVIIATNEKIDSAIRHQASWLSKIGLIIADEVHLINDSSRGPTLEVVLAELRNITNSQILALSATITNANEIAKWLDAELVSSQWRPVKLKEGVLYDNTIIYAGEKETTIPLKYKNSFNNLIHFILSKKSQALVFNTTRNMTESTVKNLASTVAKTLTQEEKNNLQIAANQLINSGEQTKQAKNIADLIRQGVAFHHAGLSPSQRRIVESNFKNGNIKILSATTTLAAGINLPARYVVIKSIYRYDVTLGNYPIPVLEFKQQAGRAGRPQFDTEGDALVIAKNEFDASNLYSMYIEAETEDIISKIAAEPALRSIVLGQIATENTQTISELREFFSQTFYGYKQEPTSLDSILKRVIEFLREEGLITNDPNYLIATTFGKRLSQLYIDPLSGITIREGISNARTKAKQLLTDISFLHLICTTPDVRFVTIRKNEQIPMVNYISEHEDEFLTPLPASTFELELFMSQLKTALILKDWISETPEDFILERFNVGSGDVYSTVSSAEWLLYATTEIAKLLGYSDLALKTSALHERVINGIKAELVDLVQIPGIGRVRARALFNKGYDSRNKLKEAKPEEIVKIPGFGKEIVRNIFLHLLGDQFSDKQFDFKGFEGDSEDNEKSGISQKQMDDFF